LGISRGFDSRLAPIPQFTRSALAALIKAAWIAE
jgi:hypothetical protein